MHWLLKAAIVALALRSSTQASFITITHVTEGPPVIQTDGSSASFTALPEWALGDLLMPLGSVPLGPDGTSFHVVLFTDPSTLRPTALVTLQASRDPQDIFMYISFVAAGGTGFDSEVAAYTGQPFTSTALADGTLQDISALLDSGELKFSAQISPVQTPESGETASLLALSLLLPFVFATRCRSGLR
jgi:hypothetical protein